MLKLAAIYKNAYSGLSASSWWLSLVMLINRCGTMVMPFMTLYLTRKLHYNIGQAGIVMAIFGLGAVCGGYIGGRLSDRLGFYYIQVFALLTGGVMFIVLGQMSDFLSICIASFVLSLFNDAFRPANAIAVAQYSSAENRTRSFSLNRLAINLGWAIGGALGGFIAAIGYNYLFWIDGLTNIFAAFLLIAVLAPSKNAATPKTQKHTESGATAFKDKVYIVFIVLTFLYGFCFFQLFSTLPVYYRDKLNLATSFIGLNMAMNGMVITLFELVIIYRLEGRRNILHYITAGICFVSASYLVLNLLPGRALLALLAMLLVTAGEMLSMPFMNSFWVSRTNEQNRGRYAGLYATAWSLALVLGPGLGAQIAQHFGFRTLWWTVGILSIIVATGFKWLDWFTER